MKLSRTDEEIDTLMNEVGVNVDQGVSRFPGQTYEEGVAAAIAWLCGDTDDYPFPED